MRGYKIFYIDSNSPFMTPSFAWRREPFIPFNIDVIAALLSSFLDTKEVNFRQ